MSDEYEDQMEKRSPVQALRALELKRIEVLKETHGKSADVIDAVEDPILDEMDAVWWDQMSQEERDYCMKQGPNHEETLKWIRKIDEA